MTEPHMIRDTNTLAPYTVVSMLPVIGFGLEGFGAVCVGL